MGQAYRAFISYSHRDEKCAKWLHKRLETYRFPSRLVGRPSPFGLLPRTLVPIFRDREELSAGESLSAKVRQALEISQVLLVICSPAAAASAWVNREIEEFRALHPERTILLALVEGEPETAFPAALSAGKDAAGHEPLAADLRPQGDGRRLGLLKLLAGIVDVPLGELVQRDAQRKMRRVTLVTALAVVAMAVLSASTIMAVRARHEAERQRASAEGLVEFMLTDLRGRLKGVGRLDILSAVNRRALGYYQQQDVEQLPVDSLERRARILLAMGEDDEQRGELARALAQFDEAARTTRALLDQKPDDTTRIYNHAQSEFWVGLVYWRAQRVDTAQKAFERYAELAGRLVRKDPANPKWLMESGYAASNLGTLLLRDRGDEVSAEKYFRASLDMFQRALPSDPGDAETRSDISDAHGWIADCYRAMGRYSSALAEREEQRKILQGLAVDYPLDVQYQHDLLTSALGSALVELDSGAVSQAQTRLEGIYGKVTKLAALDPANESIEKMRIATGLFLAKAILRNNPALSPPALGKARTLLAGCNDKAALSDNEITGFCEVLTSRLERRRPILRLAGLSTKSRFSPRWGIDFSAEERGALLSDQHE